MRLESSLFQPGPPGEFNLSYKQSQISGEPGPQGSCNHCQQMDRAAPAVNPYEQSAPQQASPETNSYGQSGSTKSSPTAAEYSGDNNSEKASQTSVPAASESARSDGEYLWIN